MRIKVNHHRGIPKVRLLPQARFVCPWCWAVSHEAGRCRCGSEMERERYRIVLQFEQ